MPYLQLRDQRYPLRAGPTRVGTASDAEIQVPSGVSGSVAVVIVDVVGAGQATIRCSAPGTQARVNSVPLGIEPAPLIHGDRVEIAGTELIFGDDRRSGSTQAIPIVDLAAVRQVRQAPAGPSAVTNGRIVSLVDGREFSIPPKGLTIGRDVECDVVLPSTDVSRRHAELRREAAGYAIVDTSTNGLFVNGERVDGSRILQRGDVFQLGSEEFRFHAEPALVVPGVRAAPAVAPSAAAPPSSPPPPLPSSRHPGGDVAAAEVEAEAEAEVVAAAAPSGMTATVAPPGVEAAVQESAPPPVVPRQPRRDDAADPHMVLATLEVSGAGGSLEGQEFPITAAFVSLGRGSQNTIVLADDTVSSAHATLRRRDRIWYITDVGSRNGTYVNGRRIHGETRLGQVAEVRLGGVKLAFAAIAVEPVTAPVRPTGGKGSLVRLWLLLLLVLGVAAVVFFYMRGR